MKYLSISLFLLSRCVFFAQSLYVSPSSFTPAVLDGYVVKDTAHNRDVPILIRYPSEAIASGNGPLPLILWSHGGGANVNGKNNSREWSTALVQAGYILIHMSHLPRNMPERVSLYQEFGVPADQYPNAFGTLEVDRPRDANAVLADLDGIENFFPVLKGRIQRKAIAVAGHSFGSYTALTLAGGRVTLAGVPNAQPRSFDNPLPKAFLALSTQGPGRFGWKEDSYGGVTRPVLFATGLGDYSESEQAPSRVRAHYLMPPGENLLLFFNTAEATHPFFNLNEANNTPTSILMQNWLISTVVAWFDAQLKELPSAKAYLDSGQLESISQRKAALDIRRTAFSLTSISSSSNLPAYFAQDGLFSAFGSNLASSSASATTTPLPVELAGVSLRVRDSAGIDSPAPLLFVSPTQVNYQLPPASSTGIASIRLLRAGQLERTETAVVFGSNPGLFSADASGSGLAAAFAQWTRPDGSTAVQAIARYDAATARFVAEPIDLLGPSGPVYLSLYGTGLRGYDMQTLPSANAGSTLLPITFLGAQGSFAGLDQVNLVLPRSLAGTGEISLQVVVDQQASNPVRISVR